jgi:FixJ family two-component response regulator
MAGTSDGALVRASLLEDDALLRLDLEERLRTMGIEAMSFSSEEALAAALEPPPAVAIVNLALDSPRRIELAALLRNRGIAVVPCSSTPGDFPGVPLLTKPFDDEALAAAIAEAMAVDR